MIIIYYYELRNGATLVYWKYCPFYYMHFQRLSPQDSIKFSIFFEILISTPLCVDHLQSAAFP